MGEVRVKALITNSGDLASSRKQRRAKARSYLADALVDTGAVRTVLPPQVAKVLGLPTYIVLSAK